MTLSKYQLQHIDLITEIEQNPTGRHRWNGRVSTSLFRENSRSLETMGDLLRARMFGATESAINLRKRMIRFVQGGGQGSTLPGAGSASRGRPPEFYPDPHPEHGVLCDCDDCDAAVKRLLRDCGVLPKGSPDYSGLTAEPITGRVKVPVRYRKDESDR